MKKRMIGLLAGVLPLIACTLAPTGQEIPASTPTPLTGDTVPEIHQMEEDSVADTSIADPYGPDEPTRIQFAPGATSAQVTGTLPPSESHQYVLGAMAAQTMYANLLPPPVDGPDAILIIWGEDGTVLISDHAGATTWEGALPMTQDYIIAVRSVAGAEVSYTLDVIIPPPASERGIPSLTVGALKNAEYLLGDAYPGNTCQLEDGFGQLSLANPPGAVLDVTLTDWGPIIAFGDVDSDDVADAAVILSLHMPDTTGHFKQLAVVLNEVGQPDNVATTDLGDRTRIEAVAIQDGVITLDVITHGPDDGLCCPTVPAVWTYTLVGDELVAAAGE